MVVYGRDCSCDSDCFCIFRIYDTEERNITNAFATSLTGTDVPVPGIGILHDSKFLSNDMPVLACWNTCVDAKAATTANRH